MDIDADTIRGRIPEKETSTVDMARAGNAAAFASLFDTYHGPITGYLYRLTGDRHVADDLAQETFMKALRALPGTDEDLRFSPWLYRIATNTANSWHRRRRILTWLPLPSFRRDVPELRVDSVMADDISQRDQIYGTLQAIGITNASILLLRYHQQLTLGECAETLGVSLNTAKVRLYRARKAFVETYTALDTSPDTSCPPGRGQR